MPLKYIFRKLGEVAVYLLTLTLINENYITYNTMQLWIDSSTISCFVQQNVFDTVLKGLGRHLQ